MTTYFNRIRLIGKAWLIIIDCNGGCCRREITSMQGGGQMKQFYVYLLTLSVLIPKIVVGSGFHLPYQSVTAMGLADAHVAYTPGPDSSYYNPANMSYLSDSWKIDGSFTTLYLASLIIVTIGHHF